MKVQVVIIGGGPAGMLLSEILYHHGIETLVLEKKSRDHVQSRIRAGVLEQSTVDLLQSYGLGKRMLKEGKRHEGFNMTWGDSESLSINLAAHTGKSLMTYGQAEIQKDLYQAADQRHAAMLTEVDNVRLVNLESDCPYVTFSHEGVEQRVDCDFVAGCDGFHGISRKSIPKGVLREYEKIYPFGWLGILAQASPLPYITYASHSRGFALASSRSPTLSRYYIQVPREAKIEDWSDDHIWDEIKKRFPAWLAESIQTAPAIEKSVTRLRSYIVEPLHYGRLFLAGDAAHILPPTGAKGLNLAVADVYYLSRALVAYYHEGVSTLLDSYSHTALYRVWNAARISRYMTQLLHSWPGMSEYDQRERESELYFLKLSHQAQAALALQYAGLAF